MNLGLPAMYRGAAHSSYGDGHLLLQPDTGNVTQADHGHGDKKRKVSGKKIVPVSSNRNSQGQHAPFEQTALPPFQRECLE
jgi:hypothetical protein